ncbi:MAG: hypothetical protein IJV30_09545 [Oscillospiraceae bacterium]|nr:hypothetical protein [Oscillospiraceae bacterium]
MPGISPRWKRGEIPLAAYNFISVYLSVVMGMTVFQRTFFTKDDIFLGFCLRFGQNAVGRNAGNRKPGRKILNIFLLNRKKTRFSPESCTYSSSHLAKLYLFNFTISFSAPSGRLTERLFRGFIMPAGMVAHQNMEKENEHEKSNCYRTGTDALPVAYADGLRRG